nr:MAG TPA: hypothetical protein [Caudoviricetes sp.]
MIFKIYTYSRKRNCVSFESLNVVSDKVFETLASDSQNQRSTRLS